MDYETNRIITQEELDKMGEELSNYAESLINHQFKKISNDMDTTYEQKYKEANDKVAARFGTNVAKEIFTDLYESEDEKIRKELIDFFQDWHKIKPSRLSVNVSDILAWLEKQGKKNSVTTEEEEKVREQVVYAINKLNVPESEKNKLLAWLEKQKTIDVLDKEEREFADNVDSYRKDMDEFYKKGYNAGREAEKQYWLEKQGSEPNWCHHKVDLSNCSEEYRKAYYDGWNNCNMQHSQCKSDSNDVIKCLINGMKFYYEDNEEATWGTEKFSMKVKDILSWLEKQGEQEQLYIRFGEIPTDEKSKIFQGEIEVGTENGVSVYPAFKTSEGDIVLGLSLPITKTTLYTQQHLIEYDDRPCYLVRGDYVGKDTDGQPLINNVSIIEKIDTYRVKEKKQREQKLAWSEEDKKLTDVNHEYFSELLENNNSKDINDYAYQVAYCMSHDWANETPTWDDVQKACKLGAEWNEKHMKGE